MKAKRLTRALLAGVLLIWGLVFFRIANAVSGNEKPAMAKSLVERPTKKTEVADTFTLLPDYRDPFLGKAVAKLSEIVKVEKTSPVVFRKASIPPPPKAPPVPLDSIASYRGLIANKKNNRKVALLHWQGQEYLAMEGEIIGGIKILKYHADSVKVSYERKTHWLKRTE